MTWASTASSVFPLRGGLRIVGGTFTDASSGGSTITTGLANIVCCGANANVTAKAIGVSGSGGTLTIYGESASTDDGYWWAMGQ